MGLFVFIRVHSWFEVWALMRFIREIREIRGRF